MLKTRSIALAVTVAALATLSAGCQRTAEAATAAAAAPAPAVADNTAEICAAFRHFELDHQDKPIPAGSSFDAVAAADLTRLAARATDPAMTRHLTAIATQVATLGEQPAGKTYDQVAQAHPEIFTAGGRAWVSLEKRCGKAIVPTP